MEQEGQPGGISLSFPGRTILREETAVSGWLWMTGPGRPGPRQQQAKACAQRCSLWASGTAWGPHLGRSCNVEFGQFGQFQIILQTPTEDSEEGALAVLPSRVWRTEASSPPNGPCAELAGALSTSISRLVFLMKREGGAGPGCSPLEVD